MMSRSKTFQNDKIENENPFLQRIFKRRWCFRIPPSPPKKGMDAVFPGAGILPDKDNGPQW